MSELKGKRTITDQVKIGPWDVMVVSDGDGSPMRVYVSSGMSDGMEAEMFERIAKYVADLRAAARPDNERMVCVEHGYYPASWSGERCPTCVQRLRAEPEIESQEGDADAAL